MDKLFHFIPTELPNEQKSSVVDFTRTRTLTLPKLIVFLLFLAASGKQKGVDGKSGEFFRNARRSGLWPEAQAVSRSAVSKARKKLPAHVLENLLTKAVSLAYDTWPNSPEFTWHGLNVNAIDGSHYRLPPTKEIRREFDSESGLDHPGKGHYPECLVCTLFDARRRFPIARAVGAVNTSERELATQLLPYVRPGAVLIFDRGYPSYEFLARLLTDAKGYFLVRCPARSTFPAVEAFVRSGKDESEIHINPTFTALRRTPRLERSALQPLRLRAVRREGHDGAVSVLLTNLNDHDAYPRQDIIDLYSMRWEAETEYKQEKNTFDVLEFNGRTSNAVRQELFAMAIMTVIAQTLTVVAQAVLQDSHEPQVKNAIMTLASDAAVLAADDPEKAVAVFEEILQEIMRVPYYRPKLPRPSQPRVTKRPVNKWALSKSKVMVKA